MCAAAGINREGTGMSEEVLSYEARGATAVITIRRPDAMNAFNARLRRELGAALERAAADDAVRVVVLTGEGRCFSAGADLRAGPANTDAEATLQQEYRPIFETLATMRQPVIAAVAGSAAGIGMSLALACDLVMMADDAFLLAPFTNIALVPDGGLCWFLVHQLGYRRACELGVEPARLGAARCVERGLANRAVPAASLMDEALGWAEALAERAPLAVAATKKAMRLAAASEWAATFDVEAGEQKSLRRSADHREGVAAFFEKRKPRFEGR